MSIYRYVDRQILYRYTDIYHLAPPVPPRAGGLELAPETDLYKDGFNKDELTRVLYIYLFFTSTSLVNRAGGVGLDPDQVTATLYTYLYIFTYISG